MKILYHHRINSKDGQAVHMEELIRALREEGHEVLVVGPKSFAQASFGHDPSWLNALKRWMPRFLYEVLEIGYNVIAYARLRSAYLSFRPDILYERSNLYTLAGSLLKRASGVPFLLEVNAPMAQERGTHGGLAFPSLARSLERWTWQTADYVLPVTRVLADLLEAGGAKPEHVEIIPNGVSRDLLSVSVGPESKKAFGLEGKIVLGFTGFVKDWHGLDRVLDWVAERAPANLHLLVVGDGPAVPALKSQTERLKIADKVTFAGLVARDRIASYVAAFDIALQPKCVEYCSPLKLPEYMALGKAVVAPDQPNIREVLVDGKNALLFEAGKPQRLSDALDRLVTDSGLRDRLGAAARQTIEQRKLTWEGNAQRVISLARTTAAGSAHVAVRGAAGA